MVDAVPAIRHRGAITLTAARPFTGQPVLGVQDVSVAHPVDEHEALVVAAARDTGLPDGDRGERLSRPARVADADDPGLAIRVGADRRQVAAQIDQTVAHSQPPAALRAAIDGVLLDEAAKVELHVALGEHQTWALPAHALPADPACGRPPQPPASGGDRNESPTPVATLPK